MHGGLFPAALHTVNDSRGSRSQGRKTRLMPRGGDSRARGKVLLLSLDLSQVCWVSLPAPFLKDGTDKSQCQNKNKP